VPVDLIEPAGTIEIPVEQTAGLKEAMALAITAVIQAITSI